MNDYEIVILYFKRDEAAISETEKKYGAYCFKIAHNILGYKEDVEECLNDMYHHAWNAIPPASPKHLGPGSVRLSEILHWINGQRSMHKKGMQVWKKSLMKSRTAFLHQSQWNTRWKRRN